MKKNTDFKIKFWGVRGSYPIADKNFLEYGGNTSCIEINAGSTKIILDGGTGIIPLGDKMFKEHISSAENAQGRKPMKVTMLLSHIHQDHIQGLNFFKPLNVLTTQFLLFGYSGYDSNLDETLSELIFGKSFPINLYDITADIDICDINEANFIILNCPRKFRDKEHYKAKHRNEVRMIEPVCVTERNFGVAPLKGEQLYGCDEQAEGCDTILNNDCDKPIIKRVSAFEEVKPKKNEVIISTLKLNSHPNFGVMAYKISYKDKSVVYATDTECYSGGSKKLELFAKDTDLLIHDSQYTTEDYLSVVSPKQGFGHSTFDMAFETAKAANVKQLAFFHFDPSYDDKKLTNIENSFIKKNKNCFFAKEGLEICL